MKINLRHSNTLIMMPPLNVKTVLSVILGFWIVQMAFCQRTAVRTVRV